MKPLNCSKSYETKVYSNVESNISGATNVSNASIAKINANIYKGFDLGSIAPIVLAAGLIITIVIGFAGLVMGGGQQ